MRRSLLSPATRASVRSSRRTTTSGRNTRPVPPQDGQSSAMVSHRDGRTRWRVISIRPSCDTWKARVRARSRPRWLRSSCSTLSRFRCDSMSMKSITMIPPKSRSRTCRAISRAASRLVRRIVFSGSCLPVYRPVFTSIDTSASVGSMIRYPPVGRSTRLSNSSRISVSRSYLSNSGAGSLYWVTRSTRSGSTSLR